MMIAPRNFEGLTCTINTTEDCNLRCKYCYEINKKPKSITFETAKKFIDLILQSEDPVLIKGTPDEWLYKGIVFDFIGGDSLMDVDLLDKIFTYINTTWNANSDLLDKWHPKGWRGSISTNGTLFAKPEVREFCEKWCHSVHVGVSIDGCPTIHDMNRVFPDGSGSMATILKWWPWYQKTFPFNSKSTKATCAKNSIPYLFESLKFMHEELGLKWINQNFIMEDTGCTEEDYKELDRQLEKCANYCLEHQNELYWSMLDNDQFGLPARKSLQDEKRKEEFYTSGRCGSGKMPCCGINGDIYPCFRWLPHTQYETGTMKVGNVNEGFTTPENFVCVQKGSIRANCTKDPKCLDCEYEPSCAYCIGGCYAEFGDFIRTTYICEITKLQCKWAEYYWSRYER